MTSRDVVESASMPEPSPPHQLPANDAAGPGARLGWLDVLRGLAALAVVFDHLSYYLLQHIRAMVYHWFDAGNYGVFVFFIISGYIVPASLERKGSVRTFWVSRLFRLYPLYLLAVGLAVALYLLHFGSLRGEGADPETSFFSQLLMMSNVLAGQNLPNVVWSLSYEMVFYLLLTALFIARVNRRSSWYALAFAAAAVAIGGLLPQAYLTHNVATPRLIALTADLAVLAGLALAVVLRGMSRLLGAAIAAVVAVGNAVDPGPDVHRDGVLPGRTGPVLVAQGHRGRSGRAGVRHHGRPVAQPRLGHGRPLRTALGAPLVLRLAAGRPDVRGRAGVPARPVAARADLARPDQLLRLPAASAGHRGLPPLPLDAPPPPVPAAGPAVRRGAGRRDRAQLADVPVRRTADAERRAAGGPLAGCPFRPRPDTGHPSRAPAGHGGSEPADHRVAHPHPRPDAACWWYASIIG